MENSVHRLTSVRYIFPVPVPEDRRMVSDRRITGQSCEGT